MLYERPISLSCELASHIKLCGASEPFGQIIRSMVHKAARQRLGRIPALVDDASR